jgi:hypothetical protein
MYKFFHDPKAKIVFRCRAEPDVVERKSRGKLSGWQVRLDTDITRADNWLESTTQWYFAVRDVLQKEFDYPPYSREQAISWFLQRNSPANWNTVEIDPQTYAVFEAEYKAQALNNTPNAK